MASHRERNRAVYFGQSKGPLREYIRGFAALSRGQGYTNASINHRLRLVRDLDRWMQKRRVRVEGLSEERCVRFFRDHRKRHKVYCSDDATVRSLLTYLRDAKVVEPPIFRDQTTPIDRLQADFATHLREQRGLRPATLEQHLLHTRLFLFERFGSGALRLNELTSQDIIQCVLGQARTVSRHAARCMAKALRGLLRFLRQRGDITTDLAASVPSVAYWSQSELPKYLTPEQIALVLKHSEQGNATIQRDRAILLLLAQLGLRASEVVRMRLEDIDWEAGELTVHGKGGRDDRLPLPRDVGQCLVEYLQRIRPWCACRDVFIRARAPHQGFTDSAAVDIVVQQALRRAGLNPPTKGTHLFRHGLATRMLHNGASLTEIGKVLRHRSVCATSIYAKVNLDALPTLAQPWLGGGA
jgi:integrase/recombinase XerD